MCERELILNDRSVLILYYSDAKNKFAYSNQFKFLKNEWNAHSCDITDEYPGIH